MDTAVVIFSGGQDSTTCLLHALQNYKQVHAITFDYGQRHQLEVQVAQKIAKKLSLASHKIVDIQMIAGFSQNALTDAGIDIQAPNSANTLPNTFVPGRNILFFTLAGIFAYQVGAKHVLAGVCETDFSGYPDCRSQFVTAMEKALQTGMDSDVQLITPLMWLDKAQIWAWADQMAQLPLIEHDTLTCYEGIIGHGCGQCPACLLRQRGLQQYLADKETYLASLQAKMALS